MKLKNHVWRFPRRTKIADFRKNAEKWKHCFIHIELISVSRHYKVLVIKSLAILELCRK